MFRFSLGRTPYAGVLFRGWAYQIVDNKPVRETGWNQPVSGRVIFEWILPF
jgi:hypothetical protein